MGTTYTATIDVRCLKEHTCICCGAIYAYHFNRSIKGTGKNEAIAQTNAQAAVRKALESDVDLHPCPTCGLYQPDMLGQQRRKKHWGIFWLALVALGILLIVRATSDALQATTATWGALLIVGAAVAVHLMTDLKNPNADLMRNQQTASDRMGAGVLVTGRAGRLVPGSEATLARPARSVMHLAGLVLLFVAIGLVLFPELMRSSKGWPVNEDCYPPVVGPGDNTRIYMQQKITSIKSYWRGRAKVDLRDASSHTSLGLQAVGVTNEKTWGNSISAKSKEKNNSSWPWVNVSFPDSPVLAGKRIDCDIMLNVEYPASTGSSSFDEVRDTLKRQVQIDMAKDPKAGATYNAWWWEGTAGGAGTLLLAGAMLTLTAKAFARRALPTRILTEQAPTV